MLDVPGAGKDNVFGLSKGGVEQQEKYSELLQEFVSKTMAKSDDGDEDSQPEITRFEGDKDDEYGLSLKDCVEKHAGIFKKRSTLGSMFDSYLKDNKDKMKEYKKCTTNAQRNKMKAEWAKEEYDHQELSKTHTRAISKTEQDDQSYLRRDKPRFRRRACLYVWFGCYFPLFY